MVQEIVSGTAWRWPDSAFWRDIELQTPPCFHPWPNRADSLLWLSSLNGEFSVASAYSSLKPSRRKVPWSDIIWGPSHIPRFSFIVWLTLKERLTTKMYLRSRGLGIDNRCVLCSDGEEDDEHLFFKCPFSQRIWIILLDRCGVARNLVVWKDVVGWMSRRV
ncbi:hypothetical protein CJ030_MR0G003686 [Morella rubra]|uniref:Reverse transcriptase zinc-binding domain-containing protein n=1 Tax=Morella rubra TaxID=262757 RepID=A0A6A1UMF4_9ROSI|nr:hypothetical protein CJ030_MR0G003686 [Morella rubra]